jgi:hypothetical protein
MVKFPPQKEVLPWTGEKFLIANSKFLNKFFLPTKFVVFLTKKAENYWFFFPTGNLTNFFILSNTVQRFFNFSMMEKLEKKEVFDRNWPLLPACNLIDYFWKLRKRWKNNLISYYCTKKLLFILCTSRKFEVELR